MYFRHPHPSTLAFFTFRSEPFSAQTLQNGDLQVSLDATGRFTLYLHREPCGDFSRPDTFSRGEPIAVFERVSTVVGTAVGTLASNLFSAALISSRDFSFGGGTWNLARLVPQGITQLGTASTTALPPPPGYKTVRAFVGSALALGARPGKTSGA